MLEIFDNVCILLAKSEQKHFQFTKKLLEEHGLGITPGQLVVLYALYKGDGVSITELSKKSYLDNSTLTGLIDRLERAHFVSRVDVPEDRRSYYIYLTEEANAIRDQAIAIMQSVAKTMLEGCSEEEVLVFRKVLLNIYEKL